MTTTSDLEARLKHAVNEIRARNGDRVSIRERAGSVVQFGRNDDLDTANEYVWQQGGTETYATDNDIDNISSSNAGDTQTVIIKGFTMASSKLTYVEQTIVLTGQTPVVLATPLFRADKFINLSASGFAGDIYVYESSGGQTAGVPDNTATIHLKSVAGVSNESLKAGVAVADREYLILTAFTAGVIKSSNAAVDFRLCARDFGQVYKTVAPVAGVHSNSGSIHIDFQPAIIVNPNSDIVVDAVASANNIGVGASIYGYLAKIKD